MVPDVMWSMQYTTLYFIYIIFARIIFADQIDQTQSTIFSSVFTYDFIVANGEWGCWGPYSECSATCGNGTKTRARKCNNPPPSGGGSSCIGDMEEIKTCSAGYCPSECIEQTIQRLLI